MNSLRIEAGGMLAERIRYIGETEDTALLRCHDNYEMLYVVEGSGKCVVEGIEYPIRSRTFMIFPPLAYHTINIDEGVEFERILLRFNDNAPLDVADGLIGGFMGERFSTMTLYSAPISDSIVSVMERFASLSTYPKAEIAKIMRLYVSELLVLISMVSKEKESCDERDLGTRVMKYINENIEFDVSLDRLAKRFFVSKYYLCRAFKRQNGVSVHGYITRKRVMRAKQLIDAGEAAARAAEKVGFGDYSAFYRAYVKLVGKSPTFEKYNR